jgi:flagellar M-ring protein FliF
MAISDVQQARVHVTLPKDSVFTDAREPAKASVLVGLRPGTRLSSSNVIAITNLLSSAVEGLSPESVSVVDMSGNLLSRPRREGLPDGTQATEAGLEYRQAIEHDLAAKINSTLEPLLGADKFRTGVSADIDMTSGEQSEETFDPSKSVMTSSQKMEDQSGTTRISSSPPGTAANLPPQQTTLSNAPPPPTSTQPAQPGQPAAKADPPRTGGNTTSTTRRSESITYQTSRITKHLKLPQGTVKRLSIAVLVDQGSRMEGQGTQAHRVVVPPDAEKLKAIQALVATLVGLDMTRGDQLTVEALPFDNSVNLDPGSLGAPSTQKKPDDVFSIEALKKKPALLWGSVGGAVLLIGLLVFGLSRMMRGGNRGAAAETQDALPVVDTYVGLPPGRQGAPPGAPAAIGEPSRFPALMPSRTEQLLTQLQENSRNNPEAWANILRGWLAEEEAN